MLDCVVIGAGPGGLVSTKELLERGFSDVLCLEKSSSIGGVFANSYDELQLTSSAVFSMFSDFWIGDGNAHKFWSKSEVIQYWTDYAKHFDIFQKIRFGANVTSVNQNEDGSWKIQIADEADIICKHLVLAVGNNNEPRLPEWTTKLTSVEYIHAKNYKNPDNLIGKRVLIVGGGESASDIALEVSKVAKQSWVSLRRSTGWVTPRIRGKQAADIATHRGAWMLPRSYGAKLSKLIIKSDKAANDPTLDALVDLNERVTEKHGIWGTYGTKTIALPEAMAKYGCKIIGEIDEVENGGHDLKSSCGAELADVDAIIFCTGYKTYIPFLPKHLREIDARRLYKHIFLPSLGDRIAWVGLARPAFGSQFPIMEMQARYCSHVFSNELKLPDPESMDKTTKQDAHNYIDQFEHSATSIPSLVDYFIYMNSVARIIGCTPPIYRYLLTRPGIWLKLIYGPMQGTQFRLRGRGAKTDTALAIIKKIPVSTFNHVVKAGLIGRLKFALPLPRRANPK